MNSNYYKIDPGGNITAIVSDPIPESSRIAIAKKILTSDNTIEQVGFLVEPINPQVLGRIEMMGGEFCGNAARCLAYLLSVEKNQKNFLIESSGVGTPIVAEVCDNNSQISLPIKFLSISILDKFILVQMPGISHVVTENLYTKKSAFQLLKKLGLLYLPAIGVISVIKQKTSLKIKPFVWVSATQTFYEETACASGSLAAAFCYFNGNSKFDVLQPSNARFTVFLNKDLISINGPIASVFYQRYT